MNAIHNWEKSLQGQAGLMWPDSWTRYSCSSSSSSSTRTSAVLDQLGQESSCCSSPLNHNPNNNNNNCINSSNNCINSSNNCINSSSNSINSSGNQHLMLSAGSPTSTLCSLDSSIKCTRNQDENMHGINSSRPMSSSSSFIGMNGGIIAAARAPIMRLSWSEMIRPCFYTHDPAAEPAAAATKAAGGGGGGMAEHNNVADPHNNAGDHTSSFSSCFDALVMEMEQEEEGSGDHAGYGYHHHHHHGFQLCSDGNRFSSSSTSSHANNNNHNDDDDDEHRPIMSYGELRLHDSCCDDHEYDGGGDCDWNSMLQEVVDSVAMQSPF
jgi:hypothetical protein